MNKKTDALLGKVLKSWVAQYRPPENGRARLLWEAARASQPKRAELFAFSLRPQQDFRTSRHSNEWTQTLFYWIVEHSSHAGIQARVC